MSSAPFGQGYISARRGVPSSANPFPKPDKLPTGEDYPGDWHNWLSGWCVSTEYARRDVSKERAELCAMTQEALK